MLGGWRGRLVAAATTVVAAMGLVSLGGAPGRAVAASHHERGALAGAIVGMAATPDGGGLWLVGSDGGILTDGDASYLGSMGGHHLSAPVVGMAATPDGRGYWMVGTDGGVFTFGDARFLGSTGSLRLAAPIVGMAATPDGGGYWLVAAYGGVFSFGDAVFHGSAGGLPLPGPVVGIAADPRTGGYWLVASDGGVFSYGAPFYGSAGGLARTTPIAGLSVLPDGGGYRLAGAGGGVFDFGSAAFAGAAPGAAVVAMATTPDGAGYWLAGPAGTVESFGGAASFAPLAVSAAPAPGATGRNTPGAGSYAFEQTSPDGSPSRWDPCRTIHYVVNAARAPAGGLQMISAALAEVSQATGLQFAYDGTTSQLATNARPVAAGGTWNPVLFVWEATGQSDFLPAGAEVGMGGFSAVTNQSGHWVNVTGQVALSASAAGTPGFAATGGWSHLLLHEIGHLVGLAHVSDQAQVMYPVSGPGAPASYGAGDLAGLRLLGASGGCVAEPSALAYQAGA